MTRRRLNTRNRRQVLVENPIIINLMTSLANTQKLVARLHRESLEISKVIAYVKQLDRSTAQTLNRDPVYHIRKKTRKSNRLTERKMPDNVIPFNRAALRGKAERAA